MTTAAPRHGTKRLQVKKNLWFFVTGRLQLNPPPLNNNGLGLLWRGFFLSGGKRKIIDYRVCDGSLDSYQALVPRGLHIGLT